MFDANGFAETRNSLWKETDESSEWRHKRRGTILGIMHAQKKELWGQHTQHCPHRKED